MPEPASRPVVCGVRDWADVAAADLAAGVARTLGLGLTLVHVLPKRFGSGLAGSAAAGGMLDRPWDVEAAQHLLERVAYAVGGAPATHVAHGPAGPTLARAAADADAALLVIGAPAYRLLRPTLTGTATAHLLRRARRPLLVCPAGQRPSSAAALWPAASARSGVGPW